MFKIREFSQLGQVSVKTLRYYDQLGVLKPARTDPCTGYRYYTAKQLFQLNRILAFKELGFTLEQIVQLLDEQISAEQIRGMFRLKQAEIQALIEDEQRRLTRLEGRLHQIEREQETLTAHDVVLKFVEPQMIISIREQTAPAALPSLLEELDQHLKRHSGVATRTLPYLVLWHGCEECDDATDLEVARPITQSIPESERAHVKILPAQQAMASILHPCQMQSMCSASVALAEWIETNHYQIVEKQPRREVYLTQEGDDPPIAEVQIPVYQSQGARRNPLLLSNR
ncbi:MerR family transcriptional regulator [Ktedonosporobacter rubrisoli]|uniref:MerR family transcriptional regulator n=1 Tax=Ktedonosporobacter rubrisoli TaxID=2509675 RepID=A0A4P6JZN5_KTERU|nr:MerR family transcriptional regulator [Ktedonosporobacter rubrisoli]QBD81214.1 MerR family transcriptional regulator [Ktedonosporobacter rubrisoli]